MVYRTCIVYSHPTKKAQQYFYRNNIRGNIQKDYSMRCQGYQKTMRITLDETFALLLEKRLDK